MATERITEELTLQEMGCRIGENSFGFVYEQGDVEDNAKLNAALKKSGGKPKICPINDYETRGSSRAKPEFILTLNDDPSTIICVECKKSIKSHQSDELDHPKDYAVDGVLYYSKYLKEEYNVIAVAISGTKKNQLKVSTFIWNRNQKDYLEVPKAKCILEPDNYLKLKKGEKLQKKYSLEEIRQTALEMHEGLRQVKIPEKSKPIFIAGLLIALQDDTFTKEYASSTTFKSLYDKIKNAIKEILTNSDIPREKIEYILDSFKVIGVSEKIKKIPLPNYNSLMWYIEQLELKIKPMMDIADISIDALSVFYQEFVKYSGGDGSGLGIVLTPQHLTEFMCDVVNVNKNSKVIDICCGSGSFLVTSMTKMMQKANPTEVKKIKKEGLYGVELDPELYTLAVANMIIRKDGKSNIIQDDCFDPAVVKKLKSYNINIGLINPPYSQDDYCELEFVEQLLDILVPGGSAAVVVPMSCAIGTKFKEVRERLFNEHTLKAVFSMPNDIFYPTSINVCVMVWEAHTPHDPEQETFFGYYKDDGFEKRKKLGRVDVRGKWEEIKKEWLSLYRKHESVIGLSTTKCVKHNEEWLCEAYMTTDYSKLTEDDFQNTVNNYLAHLVKYGGNK